MSEKPIMHGRDHRPGGMDPIPLPPSAPSSPPWVVFNGGGIGTLQVPANTPTTWNWSGTDTTTATNDIDGSVSTPGSTWSGAYYGVDFGSDANTINIGAGAYLMWAHYWIATTGGGGASGPYWIKIFMDGTFYGYINTPGEHQTSYVNPDTEFDGANTYGHYFHPVISSHSMTRKLVITHNNNGTLNFDRLTFGLVRLGSLTA